MFYYHWPQKYKFTKMNRAEQKETIRELVNSLWCDYLPGDNDECYNLKTIPGVPVLRHPYKMLEILYDRHTHCGDNHICQGALEQYCLQFTMISLTCEAGEKNYMLRDLLCLLLKCCFTINYVPYSSSHINTYAVWTMSAARSK